MKKGLILTIIMMLSLAMLLGACVTVEKTVVEEADDNNDVLVEDDNSEEEILEEEESNEVELPADVQSLISKGRDKISNTKYIYRYDPFSQERHGIRIMGDLVKYELPEEQRFFKDDLFDTVYLNTKTETAVGYCEHGGSYKCPDPNKPFEVDYAKFVTQNRGRFLYTYWYDLIEANAASVEVRSSQQIFDRSAYAIDVDIEGITHRVFFDEFSGMPMRVVAGIEQNSIANDARITSYEPEGFGRVTQKDVEHQVQP